MPEPNRYSPDVFSQRLYEQLARLNPAVGDLELYEFRYCLDNLYPATGWTSIQPEQEQEIEARINTREFYAGIQIKPRRDNRIVLDETIARLTRMLMVGLVTGQYTGDWVTAHFYFDVRGFFFLTRTVYFDDLVLAHLGGRPFRQFEQKQRQFECLQDIGYKQFKQANAEVDEFFIASAQTLIARKGTPVLFAIAGPTAAGKTEMVARLRERFERQGRAVTSVELDNFLTDRDEREEKGIHSLGKAALHLGLLTVCLDEIRRGKRTTTPRYDFIDGTSSHTLDGKLKPGRAPLDIAPADIVFIEGNFPFLIPEVVPLIGFKVVYLTDDPVRLKRKWKRDIDYRRKYDLNYFRNRFFKDQFMMAEQCYRPQMQVCDLVVDTTGAAIWTSSEIARSLSNAH